MAYAMGYKPVAALRLGILPGDTTERPRASALLAEQCHTCNLIPVGDAHPTPSIFT